MAFDLNQQDWRQVPHYLTIMNQKTKINETEKFSMRFEPSPSLGYYDVSDFESKIKISRLRYFILIID